MTAKQALCPSLLQPAAKTPEALPAPASGLLGPRRPSRVPADRPRPRRPSRVPALLHDHTALCPRPCASSGSAGEPCVAGIGGRPMQTRPVPSAPGLQTRTSRHLPVSPRGGSRPSRPQLAPLGAPGAWPPAPAGGPGTHCGLVRGASGVCPCSQLSAGASRGHSPRAEAGPVCEVRRCPMLLAASLSGCVLGEPSRHPAARLGAGPGAPPCPPPPGRGRSEAPRSPLCRRPSRCRPFPGLPTARPRLRVAAAPAGAARRLQAH